MYRAYGALHISVREVFLRPVEVNVNVCLYVQVRLRLCPCVRVSVFVSLCVDVDGLSQKNILHINMGFDKCKMGSLMGGHLCQRQFPDFSPLPVGL